MMGSSHATSGLLAGLLTLPASPVTGAAGSVAWVAAWGGFALLPDLDTDASTAARLWGPLTRGPARIIEHVARGHRAGTHDVLVAPAAAAVVTFAARWHPYTAFVFLALAVGLALVALDPVIPGDQAHPVTNLLVACAAAWLIVRAGVIPWWLPITAAGGVVVHIAGDAITTAGVPVPLSTWQRRRSATWGARLFDTGSRVETVVALFLWVGVAWLVLLHAPDPATIPALLPTEQQIHATIVELLAKIPAPGFLP